MRLGQEQIGFFVLHAEGVHEVICSELRLAHRSEVIRTVDITSCESRSPGADRSHLLLFTLARPPALDDGLCAMDVDRPCCRFNGHARKSISSMTRKRYGKKKVPVHILAC